MSSLRFIQISPIVPISFVVFSCHAFLSSFNLEQFLSLRFHCIDIVEEHVPIIRNCSSLNLSYIYSWLDSGYAFWAWNTTEEMCFFSVWYQEMWYLSVPLHLMSIRDKKKKQTCKFTVIFLCNWWVSCGKILKTVQIFLYSFKLSPTSFNIPWWFLSKSVITVMVVK